MMSDLVAAVDHGRNLQAQHCDMTLAEPKPEDPELAVVASKPARELANTGRPSTPRRFRTAPLPGLPRHLQYLPG